jgi:hypothetical protein
MRRRAVVLLTATLTAGSLVIGGIADAGASVSSAKAPVCKGKTKKKAIAAIEKAYMHFLDYETADSADEKAPYIQYLSEPNLSADFLARFQASSEANAAQAATTSVQVNEITCSGKKTADVDFDLVLNGTPAPGLAPAGTAVLEGKTWKVTGETLCNLQALGDASVQEPPHPCADILLGEAPADV